MSVGNVDDIAYCCTTIQRGKKTKSQIEQEKRLMVMTATIFLLI